MLSFFPLLKLPPSPSFPPWLTYCYFGPQLSLFWRYKSVHVNQNASHAISQHHFSLWKPQLGSGRTGSWLYFSGLSTAILTNKCIFPLAVHLARRPAYSLSWGLFSKRAFDKSIISRSPHRGQRVLELTERGNFSQSRVSCHLVLCWTGLVSR